MALGHGSLPVQVPPQASPVHVLEEDVEVVVHLCCGEREGEGRRERVDLASRTRGWKLTLGGCAVNTAVSSREEENGGGMGEGKTGRGVFFSQIFLPTLVAIELQRQGGVLAAPLYFDRG